MHTHELLVTAAVGLLTALAVCTGLVVRFKSPKPRVREESENFYASIDEKRGRLGDLKQPAAVDLSIVVPAYNEEARLPVLLEDIREYVEGRRQRQAAFSFELLVVDDGSRDRTAETALDYARTHGMRELKTVRHVINRGKGGAVTQGVMSALGRAILFCDADGATRFSDIDALLAQTRESARADGAAIAIGSRNNQ
ncbi:dolichyl-phosphate beta-glucosyltransferase, partial [Coemansia sp. RSA 2706]